MSTESLLAEREKTHGPYAEKCAVIQAIMKITEPYHHKLSNVQMVSHTMHVHKMARYLTGDPSCEDHWKDYDGYGELVVKDLSSCKTPPTRQEPPA
jgi:hypothetical protein